MSKVPLLTVDSGNGSLSIFLMFKITFFLTHIEQGVISPTSHRAVGIRL